MRIRLKHADTIISCDEQDRVYRNTDLWMRDGVIEAIGASEAMADETIDASGMLVYPGLVNVHHHLPRQRQIIMPRSGKKAAPPNQNPRHAPVGRSVPGIFSLLVNQSVQYTRERFAGVYCNGYFALIKARISPRITFSDATIPYLLCSIRSIPAIVIPCALSLRPCRMHHTASRRKRGSDRFSIRALHDPVQPIHFELQARVRLR